jgi:hypothetical protein
MALMSVQPISSFIDPTFSAVNSSDTIRAESGLLLYVKVGATATTITVTPAGNQAYSGVAKDPLTTGAVTSDERVFAIPEEIADPVTNLVTVSYSQTASVTAALFKI